MANKTISDLYTDNPRTSFDANDLFELQQASGGASGATKFSDLAAAMGGFTVDSGWTVNADDGVKSWTLPTAAQFDAFMFGEGFTTTYPITASLLIAINDELKAVRAALRDGLKPNN